MSQMDKGERISLREGTKEDSTIELVIVFFL